jgi:5-methyltetrahydrofolate--homocysteine methyltransferase
MGRREPSRGERAAWKQLRSLRAFGYTFRREQTIGRYRVYFVCLRRRLVVEIDGGVHDLPGRRDHDAQRDAWLSVDGFKVMRFAEAAVLGESDWLQRVIAMLVSRPEVPYSRRAVASPPPLEGEGAGGGVNEQTELCRSSKSPKRNLGSLRAAPSVPQVTPPPAPSPSRGGGE